MSDRREKFLNAAPPMAAFHAGTLIGRARIRGEDALREVARIGMSSGPAGELAEVMLGVVLCTGDDLDLRVSISNGTYTLSSIPDPWERDLPAPNIRAAADQKNTGAGA